MTPTTQAAADLGIDIALGLNAKCMLCSVLYHQAMAMLTSTPLMEAAALHMRTPCASQAELCLLVCGLQEVEDSIRDAAEDNQTTSLTPAMLRSCLEKLSRKMEPATLDAFVSRAFGPDWERQQHRLAQPLGQVIRAIRRQVTASQFTALQFGTCKTVWRAVLLHYHKHSLQCPCCCNLQRCFATVYSTWRCSWVQERY